MTPRFVILGGTGDLTARYLVPALVRLHAAGLLAPDLTILGAARDPWDTDRFRRHIGERLARHAADVAADARAEIVRRLEYRRADVTDPAEVAALLGAPDAPVVVYLALPPAVAGPAVRALRCRGLAPGSRVVVEKPFGEDLASAQDLNRQLREALPESAIFRMDHFLGKQTVQNLLGLRFANRIFEPVWNAGHVERVDIVWNETLGLEGRAGYYDRAGALRDMIQNHLLQLLALVAMEPPIGLGERDLRDRKVDLLRAVRRLSPDEVARCTRRARYAAGRAGDRVLPAYADEEGVDPVRRTETYAAVTLQVDNWRWSGIPFRLRTGKALARDRREIAVHFRPVPHLVFGATRAPVANVLSLTLDPDRLGLQVNINGLGDPFDLEPAALDLELAPQELPAYARLLLAVLEGDATLSIRDDEAEESWRIVEPILEAWAAGAVPLEEYPAGAAPQSWPESPQSSRSFR
jgi:glucose-6-phosphate 1-dehydrogenase